MGYLMGIDLGTSSVKVMIVDETGRMEGLGQVGYEVITPEIGRAEQDPEVWWRCTEDAIREALDRSGVAPEEISGIGFSGQMHGLVALDREGKPVDRAVIHLDQRSLKEKEDIYEAAGELLTGALLNRPSAGMLICSLLWMKRHQPEIYERIGVVMAPKDYIRYRLTGEICMDCSDASGALAFSVKERSWCMELMDRLGLKREIWPRVCDSTELVGQVTREAARATGLHVGTRVAAGAGDCPAQLMGNGVVEEGILSCNIGTASQLVAVVKPPLFDCELRCQTWCHAAEGAWILQGGSMNGGNTLSWLKNKVLRDQRSFGELDEEIGKIPAGCEGLFFLPYLAGERTPWNDPQARGVFFGLSLKHEQPHMVRAVMEGVMYNLCQCKAMFDELGVIPRRLISAGGGAKGRTWRQIQADMLEMDVHTTGTEEEACLGAAITAAVGIGLYRDVPEACRAMVKVSRDVTEPILENVKRYRENREIFGELYPRLRELYPRL